MMRPQQEPVRYISRAEPAGAHPALLAPASATLAAPRLGQGRVVSSTTQQQQHRRAAALSAFAAPPAHASVDGVAAVPRAPESLDESRAALLGFIAWRDFARLRKLYVDSAKVIESDVLRTVLRRGGLEAAIARYSHHHQPAMSRGRGATAVLRLARTWLAWLAYCRLRWLYGDADLPVPPEVRRQMLGGAGGLERMLQKYSAPELLFRARVKYVPQVLTSSERQEQPTQSQRQEHVPVQQRGGRLRGPPRCAPAMPTGSSSSSLPQQQPQRSSSAERLRQRERDWSMARRTPPKLGEGRGGAAAVAGGGGGWTAGRRVHQASDVARTFERLHAGSHETELHIQRKREALMREQQQQEDAELTGRPAINRGHREADRRVRGGETIEESLLRRERLAAARRERQQKQAEEEARAAAHPQLVNGGGRRGAAARRPSRGGGGGGVPVEDVLIAQGELSKQRKAYLRQLKEQVRCGGDVPGQTCHTLRTGPLVLAAVAAGPWCGMTMACSR
jgi:hypothetical protein